MRPTLLQYAAAWLPIVPAIVAVLFRRRINRARFWIALWCALLFSRNVGMWLLGSRGINNLWVIYVTQPLLASTALLGFSDWQPDRRGSTAFQYAVPVVVLIHIVLVMVFEDRRTFSIVATPFYFLTLLFAALWTFLRMGFVTEEPILRQDWFWVSTGIMLGAASATALGPLAWYLLKPRVDLLHAMLNVAAAAEILMLAAITRGMLCQKRPTFSGGSSSSRSSESSYSSAGSQWPW